MKIHLRKNQFRILEAERLVACIGGGFDQDARLFALQLVLRPFQKVCVPIHQEDRLLLCHIPFKIPYTTGVATGAEEIFDIPFLPVRDLLLFWCWSMRFLFVFIQLLLALGVAGRLSGAALMEELSAEQKRAVAAGSQVVVREEVPGQPWPRVRVFQRVHASPEEVAAVFFDYENAKTYIPDVLESRISKRHSPRVFEVDYNVEVPILPDEMYTARNELEMTQAGSYRISWKILKALQTKAAVGNLRIENYGDGESVICYTNLVTPGSSMAVVLKTMAMERMQKVVAAIANHSLKQKTEAPRDLARQVDALRAALPGSTHSSDEKP